MQQSQSYTEHLRKAAERRTAEPAAACLPRVSIGKMVSNAPTPIPMLDLHRQYASAGEEIGRAVADVCAGGRFILGREVGE